MPWVEKRPDRTGGSRYIAVHRDPAGRKRSAGVNAARKLTPYRRLKIDPLMVIARFGWPRGRGRGRGL